MRTTEGSVSRRKCTRPARDERARARMRLLTCSASASVPPSSKAMTRPSSWKLPAGAGREALTIRSPSAAESDDPLLRAKCSARAWSLAAAQATPPSPCATPKRRTTNSLARLSLARTRPCEGEVCKGSERASEKGPVRVCTERAHAPRRTPRTHLRLLDELGGRSGREIARHDQVLGHLASKRGRGTRSAAERAHAGEEW